MARFQTVRYPTYWVVIDAATPAHDVVFESRSREQCWAAEAELNAKAATERQATR